MKTLSKKNRQKISHYAKKNGCQAYEVTLTARLVSTEKFGDIEKLVSAVSDMFNPAGRVKMGLEIPKGFKFARLPGYRSIKTIEAGD